jgi:hypothetical protein
MVLISIGVGQLALALMRLSSQVKELVMQSVIELLVLTLGPKQEPKLGPILGPKRLKLGLAQWQHLEK